ncbi:SGNH/GDSL hydrolase family protein [Prosthecobacter dejongeii]|uniref:Alpha-galactosidase n=1 Tax=Prosthecobacter dejongeii TaxID=48465 RepID=A0A7W7YMG6_9BACT|nr:SGNH/GDSL hydrolase family protein [Prosthecobacter dejongeii]MBB5038921.1 alpha-galactosidase [Prosthecobacter dejongeii]
MTFRTRLILPFFSLLSGLNFYSPPTMKAQEGKAGSSYTKVLFLGNSITKHGPKADIDWTGNWGMAATSEANDYVHQVIVGLRQRQGSAPEMLVKNIADFERSHVGYDLDGKLAEAFAFKADLIILAIGENVPALKTDEAKAAFKTETLKLLQKLQGTHKPTILVRSSFWANTVKDQILQECCETVGGIFVNISALGKDESNYGRAERPYKNSGVANHPGDKGMKAIAEALLAALPKS